MAFLTPLGLPTAAAAASPAYVARRLLWSHHSAQQRLPGRRRRCRLQQLAVTAAAEGTASSAAEGTASSAAAAGAAPSPVDGEEWSRVRGDDQSVGSAPRTPRLVIEYCPGCRWGLRAGWMAQELLVTFGTALGEVALQPSPTTGTFTITVDGVTLFCRATTPGKGFPELKDVKRRLRDIIAPGASLGHTDRSAGVGGATET